MSCVARPIRLFTNFVLFCLGLIMIFGQNLVLDYYYPIMLTMEVCLIVLTFTSEWKLLKWILGIIALISFPVMGLVDFLSYNSVNFYSQLPQIFTNLGVAEILLSILVSIAIFVDWTKRMVKFTLSVFFIGTLVYFFYPVVPIVIDFFELLLRIWSK